MNALYGSHLTDGQDKDGLLIKRVGLSSIIGPLQHLSMVFGVIGDEHSRDGMVSRLPQ